MMKTLYFIGGCTWLVATFVTIVGGKGLVEIATSVCMAALCFTEVFHKD